MERRLTRASAALVDALGQDPFYVAMACDFEHDQARRAQALGLYFDYSMAEGARRGRCVSAGDALGAAIWSLPASASIAEAEASAKERFLNGVLGPKGNENYRRILEFMTPRAKAAVPETAWYLSIVGVARSEQGKGLGARLLAPTLAEADRNEAVCYLETFASRSLRFYNRLGFESVASHLEPITGSEYAILRRTPNPGR